MAETIKIGGEPWSIEEIDEKHRRVYGRDDSVWLDVVATITDRETGASVNIDTTVMYSQEDNGDMVSPGSWAWGNYECDCNRALFFERARGVEIDPPACSTGRFAVSLANKLNGRVFYDELKGDK